MRRTYLFCDNCKKGFLELLPRSGQTKNGVFVGISSHGNVTKDVFVRKYPVLCKNCIKNKKKGGV